MTLHTSCNTTTDTSVPYCICERKRTRDHLEDGREGVEARVERSG